MLKEEDFVKVYIYGSILKKKYPKEVFYFTKPVKKIIGQILDTANFFPNSGNLFLITISLKHF